MYPDEFAGNSRDQKNYIEGTAENEYYHVAVEWPS